MVVGIGGNIGYPGGFIPITVGEIFPNGLPSIATAAVLGILLNAVFLIFKPPQVGEVIHTGPDDLIQIEGIGPKTTKVLADAGITNFDQLAATDVAKLEQILEAADLRLAKPGSWPAQAQLAAAGHWEALTKLQDSLKGGQ